MRKSTLKGGLYLILGALVLAGCEDDGADNNGSNPDSFIASETSFSGYQDWTQVDYTIGNIDGLGNAHQAGDEEFARRVYINATALEAIPAQWRDQVLKGERAIAEGEFPLGSILVKETFSFDEQGNQVWPPERARLAMAKRGDGFNPEAGDWEWFMLDANAEPMARGGAEMGDGVCNSCHASSGSWGGLDHVFQHPSSYNVGSDFFVGYANWNLIAETVEDHPLLQSAHMADSGNALRRVYKKQRLAHADGGEYPYGTSIVKTVEIDGSIQQAVAMVKRGGEFDSLNGDWEYFMLDTATAEVMARGAADLAGGICVGCHAQASQSSGHGIDFVFSHPGDPFNTTAGYEAQLSHIDDYRNWTQVEYTIDASNGLGGAHQGEQSDFHRRVFANNTLDPISNEYPVGTILVKETFSYAANGDISWPEMGLLAMAKRGADFNPLAGDWEWLILANDASSIMARGGADLGGGMCNSCHGGAQAYDGLDFVFQHPAGSVLEISDVVADYAAYTVVDEVTGDHDWLNDTHGGAAATRKVFKSQLQANPNPPGSTGDIWPTGTAFVKEVWEEGVLNNTLVAMINRGGSYNVEGGGWQYVMFAADGTVMMEGGNETGCASCHSHANADEGYGKGWVFSHTGDPFNGPSLN